jgi:hypothetical protein
MDKDKDALAVTAFFEWHQKDFTVVTAKLHEPLQRVMLTISRDLGVQTMAKVMLRFYKERSLGTEQRVNRLVQMFMYCDAGFGLDKSMVTLTEDEMYYLRWYDNAREGVAADTDRACTPVEYLRINIAKRLYEVMGTDFIRNFRASDRQIAYLAEVVVAVQKAKRAKAGLLKFYELWCTYHAHPDVLFEDNASGKRRGIFCNVESVFE